MCVLPEPGHELDRLDGLLAVEDHLAVGLDLLTAPRPKVRIGESRSVAEGVAECLAERPALGFELLADRAILLPRVGELRRTNLLEPRFAIGNHGADDGPR